MRFFARWWGCRKPLRLSQRGVSRAIDLGWRP